MKSYLTFLEISIYQHTAHLCLDVCMCQARIFRHQFICTYGTFYVNCEWGIGACMCVLTLHSESLHCSCQVGSFFRVKEFPPPPVLVTSSGNDADGFRGICTLGGWTRLQHLYGPRIWGPRRVSLVDRWPCRADPSQVCGWHDKQQSGSHGDSWISDKVGKCSLRKIP